MASAVCAKQDRHGDYKRGVTMHYQDDTILTCCFLICMAAIVIFSR